MLIQHQSGNKKPDSGPSFRFATFGVRGFTLIEMLAVILLIGLIGTVAVPAVNSIMRGSKLTQSAQLVIDQLALARQTALTKNRAVEVRIYRYGDPETPGEKMSEPSSGRYRAIQLFKIPEESDPDAVLDPITKQPKPIQLGNMVRLSSSMFFDSGSTMSTLIGSASSSPAVPTLTASGSQTTSVSTMKTTYDSVSFRFNSDGSTNLDATKLWFLTLHNINDKDAQPKPPANFFTIQIEPTNGHVKAFRPTL